MSRLAWAAAVGASLAALPAHAAGYYSLDAGIRAIGRGGAYAVGADDLSAQYYNPAALTRVDGPRFQLQAGAVHQLVSFDRTDESEYAFDKVKNGALPFVVPNLAFSSDLGVDDFTLAVGLYTPYAPTYSYPSDGAQRYSLIDAQLIQTTLGPSAAYRIADWLSLGAGVGWSLLKIDQTLKTSVSYDPTDDPDYDVLFDISVMDPFAIAWNAGFVLEPPSGALAVGASISGPVTYTARGSLLGDFSENALYTGTAPIGQLLASDSASDDDVALTVTMPMILKAGVLVRPTDAFELEADFVLQMWSSVDAFVITDMELVVETTLAEPMIVTDDVTLNASMQDSWSVRLGGELDTSDRVALRLGTFYESAGVPEGTRSVFIPDAAKFGYGLGASWEVHDRVMLDFGFSQAIAPTNLINGSVAYQVRVDPLSGAIGGGKTVGNGDFGFLTTIGGVGVTWLLKKPVES
jgi:long-chain fatty acid transport protein